MYSSKWIHILQTCWIITMLFALGYLIIMCEWSLWLSIPVGVFGFIILTWIGLSIITLFDYNHRMAAKYGIRIENVPLYFSEFERLVKLEENGIDSSGIPSEIKDTNEWMRFCQWQRDEELRNNKAQK